MKEARVSSLFSLKVSGLVTSSLVLGALLDMGGVAGPRRMSAWGLASGFWYVSYSVSYATEVSNHYRLRRKQ